MISVIEWQVLRYSRLFYLFPNHLLPSGMSYSVKEKLTAKVYTATSVLVVPSSGQFRFFLFLSVIFVLN